MAAYADPGEEYCPFLNVSQCAVSENNDVFTAVVYNQMAKSNAVHLRIPVTSENWLVTDLVTSQPIESQTVPIPEV